MQSPDDPREDKVTRLYQRRCDYRQCSCGQPDDDEADLTRVAACWVLRCISLAFVLGCAFIHW